MIVKLETNITNNKVKAVGKIKDAGITMIALVVTIVVLLILASITIGAVTSENGILRNANDAKEQTEIAEEKEIVDRATIQAMGNNKRGNIVEDELQEQLDKIADKGKTDVLQDGKDTLYVYFAESNRYYTVNIDGIVNGPVIADRVEDNYPGDITKDKDGNELTGNTESDAYQINCIEDLCALSNACNKDKTFEGKYIILTKNLDFKSDLSYINGKIVTEGNIPSCNSIKELKEILTTGEGFYPIGTNIYEGNYTFRGNFDGRYNIISNLYANYENGNIGLFGSCWNAEIKNITIEGNIISGGNTGGITAYSRGCTFINCVNRGNITTTGNYIGGISGYEYNDGSTFINCANYGEITGGRFNSGILGWDWSTYSKVFNCINANKASVGIIKNIYTNGFIKVFNVINIGECSSVVEGNINQMKSCFSLEGSTSSHGNTTIVEYNEQKMKSKEFVNELNSFIETGGNGENIDTTGWAKWLYNENDFPTLDEKSTWNGTEWKSVQ